ncbi:hypothetical protein [Streptococcus infantis]|jgi:hypothetical protein|uniref:hypothetical protein n=1 Tax=Streptococcus infantis TaxID=68892 RepID=UPI0039C19F10
MHDYSYFINKISSLTNISDTIIVNAYSEILQELKQAFKSGKISEYEYDKLQKKLKRLQQELNIRILTDDDLRDLNSPGNLSR